jgi:hypothetical protein
MPLRLFLLGLAVTALIAADTAWPAYGGGPAGIRYSPLKQIDRTNVARLHVAWSFDTDDGTGDPQTQPILINGVLYGVTPTHKVVALDGATGKLLGPSIPAFAGGGPIAASYGGRPAANAASSPPYKATCTPWTRRPAVPLAPSAATAASTCAATSAASPKSSPTF